ncbi:MAG: NUDIX domain-containing protein [Candidatus Pacearchaeota archaeon]|nr:NUDIX domain-containing protein [Candidatus Pacearchaeota archaeon]
MAKYRKAVFILAYSNTKKGIEYLLLKRKLHWTGWEFPKGKIEPGESKVNAAKRELKEETGHSILKIRKFNFSGKYYYHKALSDRKGLIGQTFQLYAAEIKKRKVSLDKKEHNRHKWADFKTALKMLKWANQKKSLKIVNSYLNRK